ncbi:hypothetical protein BR93DRAFT_981867 [Coniochaeta sp. PMI_546]|nr:hypothetical protein BR93DRAFT_981867 [Coniochaeta sp. PMI_546]
MASPPDSPGGAADLFDPSVPFKGVVVCCTSIPPEQRTEIAQKAAELGGLHKYDLTPDVTHLIVGEYDTPKYRHVARERPDIRPMAVGWIEAVRDLWVQDADIDFALLEAAWRLKTFETGGGGLQDAGPATRSRLLCCLTGFEDGEMRQRMIETITANGADYTGDLTRKVTHLIVNKPEGKKYAAAKSWNVQTVAVEWLYDSVERGMILDEKCYDPVLPKEERGKGAWIRREVKRVSLGKRLRDTAAAAEGDGRRKLRKTASMKLSSQRDNMWGDILGKPPSAADPQPQQPDEEPTQPNPRGSLSKLDHQPQTSRSSFDTQGSKLASFGAVEEVAVFSSCCFYVHGFPPRHSEIVVNYISSLGGLICPSLDDISSNSGAQMAHRFMIVPQDAKPGSYPQPPAPDNNIQVVTEFFVEKCMHKKQFFNPASHVIGRPFPVFPLPGFGELSVSTAGFTGVDLNHVDKAIRQLGARYDERFKASTSLLVCSSLQGVRRQKLDLALQWRVPVVSASWLWTCISEGVKVPIKRFLFKELRQRFYSDDDESPAQEVERPTKSIHHKKLEAAEPARPGVRDIDTSAFAVDKPFPIAEAAAPARKEVAKEDSTTTAEFETAPTHPDGSGAETSRVAAAPLSEASSDSLNRASSLPRPDLAREAGKTISDTDAPSFPTKANSKSASVIAEVNRPATITNENTPPPPPQPKAPSQDRDREKAALKAAERLALSARLATLLDTTSTAESAVAAGEAAATAAAPAAAPASASASGRRRRQILGRAVSNVSAASSGSVDSSSAGGGMATGAGGLEEVTGEVEVEGSGTDRNFSSTQLRYEDPEAEAQKERLKGNRGGRVKVAEKITLASAGGYGGGIRGGGTRSRRR